MSSRIEGFAKCLQQVNCNSLLVNRIMKRVPQSAQRRDHDILLANGIMITERSRYTAPHVEQDLASWAEHGNRTRSLSDTVCHQIIVTKNMISLSITSQVP